MKNIIISTLFCFIISNISGQTIEFSGGMNRNHFFDWQKDNGGYHSEYTPGNGYSAELSLSELNFDSIPIKISLLVDNYKGSFYTQFYAGGGSYQSFAETEKTTIGIGLYPLNFTILKKIKLSFGGELSYKIYDRTNGYKAAWGMYGQSSYITFGDDSVQMNKDFIWGLSGKLSYNFDLNRDWAIAPQYKFYLGMSDEFINVEEGIRSFRHYFEVCIIKRIK
jgi:hypothetical protein